MAENEAEGLARLAFIRYRQLVELLGLFKGGGTALLLDMAPNITQSYNAILRDTKKVFAIDSHFNSAISHLEEYPAALSNRAPIKQTHKIQADAQILMGTLRGFIEMYMSGDQRRKIGFTP